MLNNKYIIKVSSMYGYEPNVSYYSFIYDGDTVELASYISKLKEEYQAILCEGQKAYENKDWVGSLECSNKISQFTNTNKFLITKKVTDTILTEDDLFKCYEFKIFTLDELFSHLQHRENT